MQSLDSEEGIIRLNRSLYKKKFVKLATNFQNQAYEFSCAIASATIVANAILGYTKRNYLSNHLEEKNDRKGLTLSQEAVLLTRLGLKVDKFHIDSRSDLKSTRNIFLQSFKTQNSYVLVNINRAKLNYPATSGHFSPLGLFDESTDSFLFMDVKAYVYGWKWIPTKFLFEAMKTKDGDDYRGFLIVSL